MLEAEQLPNGHVRLRCQSQSRLGSTFQATLYFAPDAQVKLLPKPGC